MVQYSKRTFGCQFSNETDLNHDGFLFFEKKKNRITIMQCFKVFLKDCNAVFVCFFPEIRTVHGWGQSHLKTCIQRIVLSTEPFLRDILGPRYFKNNSGLSVNQ